MMTPEQEGKGGMAHGFYARIYCLGECCRILREGMRSMPAPPSSCSCCPPCFMR